MREQKLITEKTFLICEVYPKKCICESQVDKTVSIEMSQEELIPSGQFINASDYKIITF